MNVTSRPDLFSISVSKASSFVTHPEGLSSSRSLNSLRHLHSIKVGIVENLQCRFSALLEFRLVPSSSLLVLVSSENSINFNSSSLYSDSPA